MTSRLVTRLLLGRPRAGPSLQQRPGSSCPGGEDSWEAMGEPSAPAAAGQASLPPTEEKEEELDDWEAGLMADGTSLEESSALSSWSEEDVRNALRLAMMSKDAPAMKAAVEAAKHLGMLREAPVPHPMRGAFLSLKALVVVTGRSRPEKTRALGSEARCIAFPTLSPARA